MQCNIEIQIEECEDENARILYYWGDTYTRQVKRGEEYKELNKTVSIVILDHEIEELEGIEELGVKWQIRDNGNYKRILTDRLEIVIIEIPKAKRIYEKEPKNKISQWMMFMDNPNEREVFQIMKKNETIKKAIGELEQVSGDERLRRIAELREKGRRDAVARESYVKRVAREEGLASGIAKGRAEGTSERNLEIAKNMLKENIEIEIISKVTGLSKEEIVKLKD